ncbi:MAG: hypothetical protein FH759_02170 [Sediminimonas qiaohouensis]|uniref:Uncharacterized protein n=1 Tax=Sediminimonas qiaohouensis TaxID=552061 RepID=A0A7C9H9J9_9RHOB|nr:hypothetical protein [Sediminimonas qiaohouensis]MTJ03489.1 hypothetical protein [Sediminimonas qiaohouensis]
MAQQPQEIQPFNIAVIGQAGRLQYEALLFAASLRHASPGFNGRLFVATPQPGPLWDRDPTIRDDATLSLLSELGAEILPFESRHFGQAYPYGNKIEALLALPEGEPFVFFDTDTLITGELSDVPFDFSRPSASRRVEGTWPKLELYGPGYTEIWKSLYDRFGLDFDSSLDLSHPDEHWRRYLYFNAGFFYYRCPHEFGQRFLDYALEIRDAPPPELQLQEMDPWLDQVALPLVIHSLGGGRDALEAGWLDGHSSCHYRLLPLLYAREDDRTVELLDAITRPNRIKKVLKQYDPFKRMIYQGRGEKVRALFDRSDLPRREQVIRNRIKRNGFWMR